MKEHKLKTLVLGAGASRGVSYGSAMVVPSPLDRDFFDLLQRLEPKDYDEEAVNYVKELVLGAGGDHLWESMERAFYTLHLRAVVRDVLFEGRPSPESTVEKNFSRAIFALLRAAHWKRVCEWHFRAFFHLSGGDRIVTFNYDLVAERALRCLWEEAVPFGSWWYGLKKAPTDTEFPRLAKLHGSVNWKRREDLGPFIVRQESWRDFDKAPGYLVGKTGFSILLPFWDKKIEDDPWRAIWRRAAKYLASTTSLVICGYSLPLTDVKALELFKQAFNSPGTKLREVCVVDPSKEVRMRWRSIFIRQKFWERENIGDFARHPPEWWITEETPKGRIDIGRGLDRLRELDDKRN